MCHCAMCGCVYTHPHTWTHGMAHPPHPLSSPLLAPWHIALWHIVFDRNANSGGISFRWCKTDRTELRTNHFPDMGSVRASYTGQSASRVGFFIRRKKVNETTEPAYETPIAPRPWHTERREYVHVNKKGYKSKKLAWFLVDANGDDVRRTYSNMQHICDCVNSTAEVSAENERELTYP